jgi:hypothetical protein
MSKNIADEIKSGSSATDNSISKQHEIDDKIEWSSEHEEILIDWADKALCLRWLHAKSNEHYSRLNKLYTVPVIIMSTLTGTANFALNRFPADYQDMATAVIGSINILAGIITTVSQFLKIAELNEAHRASALSWSKLYRNIKLELAKAPKERKKVAHMINASKEEYDRLMETSPIIIEKFIKMFKQTFSGTVPMKKKNKQDASIEKQLLFNSLNKPEVCDFIEPTKNSVYKPPEIEVPSSHRLSLMSSNYSIKPTDEELREKALEEKRKIQQREVLEFNRLFHIEKQRNPTNDEISNNFDNLIPLSIITSVLADIDEYKQKHPHTQILDNDLADYTSSFSVV